MTIIRTVAILLTFIALSAPAQAQTESFSSASTTAQKQLEDALAELTALREQMAAETLPLSRQLSQLESTLVEVRLEYQATARELDSRLLDLSNLRNEIKSRSEESSYLSNLLSEYIRNFEARLHIAEVQRYREPLDSARLAPENTNLSEQEVFTLQAALLATSLGRLEDALGGTRFEGTAINGKGLVTRGSFLMAGPAAIFRSADGTESGTAEQRLGSLEPALVAFGDPVDVAAAAQLVASGEGTLPLDPTLGNAHKIEATKETLIEHIRKGGPVMIPILVLAGLALLVALYKWFALLLVRAPSKRRIRALLQAVAKNDHPGAVQEAKAVGGPSGRMLTVGAEHLKEPRELIEEVMYESLLITRQRLNRLLPFVAVSAAAAPLLGLLGTVTGIINTFKLITVFGSGDVKTLSSGISEALITTEYGLIVAIPSLLLHAFLSRKARGIGDRMELVAMAFLNQVSRAESRREARLPETPSAGFIAAPRDSESMRTETASQVRQILAEMLLPGRGPSPVETAPTISPGRASAEP